MASWAFVDAWLLAAGILSIVLSQVWKMPNLMLNFVLTPADLTGEPHYPLVPIPQLLTLRSDPAGTILGVMLLITFVISIGGIVQRNHVTVGLEILNWTLIGDAVAIVVVGTYIWFFTLEMRNNYFKIFNAVSADVRVQIQDKVLIFYPSPTFLVF